MEAGVIPKMFFIDSVTPQVAWFFNFAIDMKTSVSSKARFKSYAGKM